MEIPENIQQQLNQFQQLQQQAQAISMQVQNVEIQIQEIKRPLEITGNLGAFDVFVNVHGGGFTGQTGAIRHGISRALVKASEENKAKLKSAGYLTRDPRMKERKK